MCRREAGVARRDPSDDANVLYLFFNLFVFYLFSCQCEHSGGDLELQFCVTLPPGNTAKRYMDGSVFFRLRVNCDCLKIKSEKA